MTIEEKRRDLFEAWADGQGYDLERNDLTGYDSGATRCAWSGFNAALDAVVIELPAESLPTQYNSPANSWNDALRKSLAAIESTGLGLKVKP